MTGLRTDRGHSAGDQHEHLPGWRTGWRTGWRPGLLLRARLLAARAGLPRRWRAHRLFLAVAALSLLPRVLAALAFRPALFTADSFGYLLAGVHPGPGQTRPAGYPLLLWLLSPFHSLLLVTTVQHLMGIATAALCYAVLRRWGLPGWGATLAAAPTLFDSRQIMLESTIWPDTLYGLLAAAAVALLLTRARPGARRCAAAGLLLAWCALVRGNGPVLIVPVLAFLLIRRAGWRAVTAGLAAFALPVLGYMTVFWTHYGTFSTTSSDGFFLWSRTMSFASCTVIRPPPGLRPLCPGRQAAYRPGPARAWSLPALLHEPAPATYLWSPHVWWREDARPGINPGNNALAMRFALAAVEAQPGAYVATVAREVMLTFLATDRSLSFRTMHFTARPDVRHLSPAYWRDLGLYARVGSNSHPVQPYAYFLGLYQLPVYFPGVVFLLVVAAGLAGVLRRWRDRGGPGGLPWAAAALGIVVPVALHEYHYRYAITAVPLACLAAGLAWSRAGLLPGAGERQRGGQAGGRDDRYQVAVAEAGGGDGEHQQHHGDRPGQQDVTAPAAPAGRHPGQAGQQDQPEQGAAQVHGPLVEAEEPGERLDRAGLAEPGLEGM
ncbi:MAG: hypothetical protein ACM32E_04635 [Gemmatimonadota bacterium]